MALSPLVPVSQIKIKRRRTGRSLDQTERTGTPLGCSMHWKHVFFKPLSLPRHTPLMLSPVANIEIFKRFWVASLSLNTLFSVLLFTRPHLAQKQTLQIALNPNLSHLATMASNNTSPSKALVLASSIPTPPRPILYLSLIHI